MIKRRVSIIGCGWLGFPLGEQLVKEGYPVKGSTTTDDKLAVLAEKGIQPYLIWFDPAPVGNLSEMLDADSVIILIPPRAGKMGDAFYPEQMRLLVQAIRESSVKQVIMASSTSIYPESNQVAVEEDVKVPSQSASPAIVDAEKSVLLLQADRNVTIVRFGGLLGYERIPGKYVAGRTVDTGTIPVNYIHRDDAVGVLLALLEKPINGVVNAVAPKHPSRKEIYQKSCADFGYEPPTFVEPVTPLPYKVISSEKLVLATNYSFIYSDPLRFFYRSGT